MTLLVRGKWLAKNCAFLGFGAAVLLFGSGKALSANESIAPIGNGSGIVAGLPLVQEPQLPPIGEASKFIPAEDVRLVIKLKERRVYLYKDNQLKTSYPVAIGKPGWETPVGTYTVFTMEVNPTFKSFKTGNIIPPGPDNPLGPRWIGFWTDGKTQLGFHGTNEPELIGEAVSHGCVRMHNEDVQALYEQVSVGMTVVVEP
jgi:L,D-transpeptidase ErfK/SrfK